MKKWNFRSYLAGVVTAVVLLGLCVPTIATAIQKQLTVTYKDIKICVDGNEISPKDSNGNKVEPFISNGTTYLPVRAVGEAFSKEVSWDAAENTVYIGTKPGTTKYSRTSPAPVGTPQTIKVKDYTVDYTANIEVIETIRGDAAWAKLKEANMFNDVAPDGKEYILVRTRATIVKTANDGSISFSPLSFEVYSNNNVEYPYASVVAPEPEIRGSVYAGGTLEGFVAFLVDKSDVAPKMAYGLNYDGSGGIWFSIA